MKFRATHAAILSVVLAAGCEGRVRYDAIPTGAESDVMSLTRIYPSSSLSDARLRVYRLTDPNTGHSHRVAIYEGATGVGMVKLDEQSPPASR